MQNKHRYVVISLVFRNRNFKLNANKLHHDHKKALQVIFLWLVSFCMFAVIS